MELARSHFIGVVAVAFGAAFLGFFVRGFGQLLLSREVAQTLAAPLFVGGLVLAVLAFLLSVLVALGLVRLTD